MKDEPGWHYDYQQTGELTVTTLTGRTHHTRPEPLTEPDPPPF